MSLYNNYQENLTSVGGNSIAYIAANTTSTIKTGVGRLCRVSVTAPGTVAFTIYDNTAASGNALFVSPAATSSGTVYDIQLPALTGITVANPASGPALAVSFV